MLGWKPRKVPKVGPPIDGITVRLSGREYVLAPITLGDLVRLGPAFARIEEAAKGATLSAEQGAAVIDVVLASARRNHPDLTRERVGEILDLGNLRAALSAAMGASGLVQAPATPGEAGSP